MAGRLEREWRARGRCFFVSAVLLPPFKRQHNICRNREREGECERRSETFLTRLPFGTAENAAVRML